MATVLKFISKTFLKNIKNWCNRSFFFKDSTLSPIFRRPSRRRLSGRTWYVVLRFGVVRVGVIWGMWYKQELFNMHKYINID